ncbi:UDP-glucosyltransferase 2-like isoform X1 [Bradysia coprophila]|uniref:UDP-glucosyltransferase 2-like isoform X1 n=1 Tax=Bradysia coprophila TaxID=38358 RepID=UPI00187D73B4|nr:UDP-glucosyltransferase 2-like isoform X1 [Bradysia coprophila]XP_037039793.1 UDP-glucosyltransferase 2-like isoform X1 [Bradysia coprophila]
MKFRQVIFFSALPFFVSAANILGLMGVPSPSHHNWNRNVFYRLAASGHNLTILSADVDREKTPGVHYIWAEKVYSSLYNGSEAINIMDMADESPYKAVVSFYGWVQASCEGYYKSKGFQTLLDYPDNFKFDLILVDYSCEPCLIGFSKKFNYPPTVGLSAFSVPHYTYHYIGGHRQFSYVPHFDAEYGGRMNFFQRLDNFLLYMWDDWYSSYKVLPQLDTAMKAAFNDPNLPGGRTLLQKMILTLCNTHFSIEKLEPLPPNIIPVGGLQIQEPKPLDKDLLQFVEKAKKGVVLFSLGTNMKSEFMDETRTKAFVEAFSQLPDYNFIWKYESDLGIPLPSNVKTLGWVRQNDILAHPKTKAFISHCGLLGTQEASWYGIPVVGIPFFADQHRNIRNGVREGTSVHLNYFTLSVDSIKTAVTEAIENPKYFRNAQRRSSLFRDQPEKPIDRATFWIEWVMRHADEYSVIQLPINDLGIIVSHSYDVIGFLLAVATLIAAILFYIVKRMLLMVRATDNKTHVKQKKH